MRDYALTYPQLFAQARAMGSDDATLGRIRTCYETSQRLFDGYHRGNGEPLECHMVRTASVMLTERQPLHVVFAALLHSAYDLHSYDDSIRRPPRASHRRWLREQIGEAAEALVWDFHLLTWPHGIEGYLADLPDATERHRQVLLLYVANELVNHLELGKAFRAPWPFRERLEAHGATMVELARAMEMPVLADELSVVVKQHLDEEDVPSAALGRMRPYEIAGRRQWQMTRARRLYVRTRAARGRLIRLARRLKPDRIRRRRPSLH